MTIRGWRGAMLMAALCAAACDDQESPSRSINPGAAGAGATSAAGTASGGQAGGTPSAGKAGQAGASGAPSAGQAGAAGQAGSGQAGAGAAGAAGQGGSAGQGGTAQGGQGGASGAPSGGQAGAAGASGTAGAAGTGCEVGTKVESAIGPEGGTLTLCGARLTVAPEALAEKLTLGIEVVQPPLAAPFEREFLGPVVRFTPDADFLPGPVTLGLARDAQLESRIDMAYHDASQMLWASFEPCPGEGELTVTTSLLGTYALLRDVNTYPPGPDGLGAGSIEGSFGEAPIDLSIDEGYAIYEQGSATSRALYLVFRRSTQDALTNLDVRFSLSEGKPAELLQAIWISTSDPQGGWSYLLPVDGPVSSYTLDETAPDEFKGSLTLDLRRGEEKRTLKANFQVKVEKFRYPGEASCSPEG